MGEKHLLFGGTTYYASGGIHDFIEVFYSRIDAINAGLRQLGKPLEGKGRLEWFHVVHLDSQKIVGGTVEQALGAPNLCQKCFGDFDRTQPLDELCEDCEKD